LTTFGFIFKTSDYEIGLSFGLWFFHEFISFWVSGLCQHNHPNPSLYKYTNHETLLHPNIYIFFIQIFTIA